MPLRIGFDAKRLFNNFTGLGNYSRTLVSNLHAFYPDTEICLFTPRLTDHNRVKPFLKHGEYGIHQGSGSSWRTWSVYKDINLHGIDIYHGLSHEIPFSSSRISAPKVVTMHDLIFRIRPRDYSIADRLVYDRKCKYACANADLVIAISENTKKDVMRYYKVPEDRIQVIYQACDAQFQREVDPGDFNRANQLFSLPDTYNLFVGGLISRKNLLAVVDAMALMKKDQLIDLVVIGSGRKYMGKVVKAIGNKGLGDNVHFLGDVPFNLFPAIYKRARALVYPSLYEGFGIPVIEALSVGTPVITSNVSSLPEAGGEAALYVDPRSPEEIKAAMLRLDESDEEREALIVKGLEHASKFDGRTLTDQLMTAYKNLL